MKLKFLLCCLLGVQALAFATSQKADERLIHEGIINAPVKEVWAAFTTKAGLESWMAAHADIEVKIGGRMRTQYDLKGVLGDAGTIENEILAYEPERMLTIKVAKAPASFPFPNAIKNMWTLIYFEAASPQTTRLRTVGMGFGDDEESKKMRAFFEQGNAYTLKKLQERFAPSKTEKQ